MKYLNNEAACFYYEPDASESCMKLCRMVEEHPSLIEPVRGMDNKKAEMFLHGGFRMYPTVKKTTLLYREESDCFFKILHPLGLKEKLLSLFKNKGRSIRRLSEYLISNDIKIPRVMAYGIFKKGRKPFFAMKRADGKSLYDTLIREKQTLPSALYSKVIDEIVKIHRLGYRFGDAHLSHIFIKDAEVSGFIDIDGIRRNIFPKLKNFAKDIAGFNHSWLPLPKETKEELLNYYMDGMGIKDRGKFLKLLKSYSERRWKGLA